MGKKSGGSAPATQDVTTKSVPYLASDVNFAASEAKNLYQGYNPQYSNIQSQIAALNNQISTAGMGGGMVRGPDGRVYDLSTDGWINQYSQFNDGVDPRMTELGTAAHLYRQGDLGGAAKLGFTSLGGAAGNVDDLISKRDALQSQLDGQEKGLPDFFPGQTYVEFSPETEEALQMITNQARGGSDVLRAANDTALGTIRGDYLNSNPYLDQVIQNTVGDITDNYLNTVVPQLNSTFAQSGRYGSGAQMASMADANRELADSIGGTSARMRYQNYDNERNRQLQTLGIAPTLNQAGYYDADRLLGVGDARNSLEQARLQDEMDRFYFYENQPSRMLDEYIGRINALNGGYGTTTQQGVATQGGPQSNPLLGGLSGATTGIGLATTLFPPAAGATGLAALGGPAGLALGGLGLLGGLFG